MNSITLLKEIARKIRYRPLPHLIGSQVEIGSLTTVAANIYKTLGHLLPAESKLISIPSDLAIAKYGLLDLEFQVPDRVLAADYQRGIAVLKEFGFVTKPDPQERGTDTQGLEDALADELFCLTVLAEKMVDNQALLKLFLEGDSILAKYDLAQMSPEALRELFDHLALPPDYFPRKFMITDACFTNAGFIWLYRHFYW